MRLLSSILLILGVVLGTLATLTAYLPRLDAVETALASGATLTLGSTSGQTRDAAGRRVPLAQSGQSITPALVERLRANGVERVRVREFAYARWTHSWLFAVAVAALVAGAVVVRRERRRAAVAAGAPGGAGIADPSVSLAEARVALAGLARDRPALPSSEDGSRTITRQLGDLQATQLDAFINARETLIARFGLAGFAGLMSRFSVFERQVNRAWSSAADGDLVEAHACIEQAVGLLADVEAEWQALEAARQKSRSSNTPPGS